MNIVVISALSPPAALYLVQKIQVEWNIQKIIRPVGSLKPPSIWNRLKKVSVSKIVNLPGHMLQNVLLDHRNKLMSKLLFNRSEVPSIPNCVDILWSEINRPETVKYIKSMEPDIILVCMAPILKPEVFSIPRIATVNVHFGIAPHYRGEHTIFWPLYFGDYDNIGVTLHQINKGIDSGTILAQGYPAVEKNDTEATLWVKSSKIAAVVVNDYLRVAQNGNTKGQRQKSKGRLFLRKDRKIWRDFDYLIKRNILHHYPADHPQHINEYF
jgi:hypothetical protein